MSRVIVSKKPHVEYEIGDCVELMAAMPENSIDNIITDPPYGLEFMGKEWDKLSVLKPGNFGGFADGNKPSFKRVEKHLPAMQEWHRQWALEALRVAKPGAFMLVFGGTRTFHRLTCGIEDAGWEIRDCIMWVYGSGFPKSHDISKAIDKVAGVERDVVGVKKSPFTQTGRNTTCYGEYGLPTDPNGYGEYEITAPASEAAKQWDGWGTTLKPAWEPIIVAMKPLDGTFAENALKHGVAGLHIDGARVDYQSVKDKKSATPQGRATSKISSIGAQPDVGRNEERVEYTRSTLIGRWPANVVHDGSDEVVELFPEVTSGLMKAGTPRLMSDNPNKIVYGYMKPDTVQNETYGDGGSASRFFYCAKASKSERGRGNIHPTVKPLELMKYLCRLTMTPAGGTILDPFAGSGTTLLAARLTRRDAIGFEKNPEYEDIILKRLRDIPPSLDAFDTEET